MTSVAVTTMPQWQLSSRSDLVNTLFERFGERIFPQSSKLRELLLRVQLEGDFFNAPVIIVVRTHRQAGALIAAALLLAKERTN